MPASSHHLTAKPLSLGMSLFQNIFIDAASACRFQAGNMTRGIVIPAGGVVLLNHAWATIKVCPPLLALPAPHRIAYIFAVPARQAPGAVNRLSEVCIPAKLFSRVSGLVKVVSALGVRVTMLRWSCRCCETR